MSERDGPVLIELEDDAGAPSPADAPPVAEPETAPTGQAMQTMATLAASRPSMLFRWFWRLLVAVVLFFVSVSAWDAVVSLVDRSPVLGLAALALLILFIGVCLAILIREWAALARLNRVEQLHEEGGAGDGRRRSGRRTSLDKEAFRSLCRARRHALGS